MCRKIWGRVAVCPCVWQPALGHSHHFSANPLLAECTWLATIRFRLSVLFGLGVLVICLAACAWPFPVFAPLTCDWPRSVVVCQFCMSGLHVNFFGALPQGGVGHGHSHCLSSLQAAWLGHYFRQHRQVCLASLARQSGISKACSTCFSIALSLLCPV